jgi:hypothetical protein
MWLKTLHWAFWPQEPGQGSLHFSLMQAWLLAHSELTTHSGLQLGGEPMYPDKQEQDGEPPISRHCENGPHGVGWHGSWTTVGSLGGGGARLKKEN